MSLSLVALSEQLRDMAEHLEAVNRDLAMPVQETIGVREAAQRLQVLLGEQAYFTISPEFKFHRCGDIGVWWEVYIADCEMDGVFTKGGFFKAGTLAEALNLATASHRKTDPALETAKALALADELTGAPEPAPPF